MTLSRPSVLALLLGLSCCDASAPSASPAGSAVDASAAGNPADAGAADADAARLSDPDAAPSPGEDASAEADAGVVDSGAATDGGVAGDAGAGESADCAGPQAGQRGQNPILPGIYTADPAVLVHDCTFYITAGRDQGVGGFDLRDWYVLSSTDMVSWSDHGEPVLGLDTFAWANANAWASQMVERDGKFYWYVPVNEAAGAMAIGVASADSPLGPFTDALGGPLINDPLEMSQFGYVDPGQTVYTIDPTVFIDDDGQAYLAYGGFGRMIIVPLGDDMISLAGDMKEITPPNFFEAPYLTKRGETYYLVYAAGVNPASIQYATSSDPMGPWSFGGTILDPLPNLPGQDAATSHPAIAEFSGQWYLVYHRSDGPGGGTYRRQVAVDKLTFHADGSIQKVVPSQGVEF